MANRCDGSDIYFKMFSKSKHGCMTSVVKMDVLKLPAKINVAEVRAS